MKKIRKAAGAGNFRSVAAYVRSLIDRDLEGAK
jgi:hypothetical protein